MRLLHPAQKTLSAALCGVFFLTQCVLAHTPEANFWAERRKHIQRNSQEGSNDPVLLASLPSSFTSSGHPEEILRQFPSLNQHPYTLTPTLPEQVVQDIPKGFTRTHATLLNSLPPSLGTVRQIVLPKGAKPTRIVVHIQDAHMNADAQKNIGQAVQALIDKKAVDLVALEGAFQPIDLSRYRSFPDQDTVRKVADYFLKENKISGPVHTAFTSAHELPPFLGVDDSRHYNANVEAYRQSTSKVKEYKDRLASLYADLDRQKAAMFSPKLRSFDEKIQAYREEKATLGDYIKILTDDMPARNLSPAVQDFVRALEMESSLDFKQVESERNQLIKRLMERLSKEQVATLLNRSIAYRLGQIRYADFYRHLRELCRQSDVPLARFPAMDRYIQYVLLADRIAADKLFKEINALEKACYARLVTRPEEKHLTEESSRLHLTGKLIDFSLTPEEWEEYKHFSGSTGFDLSSFESFYQEAHARDEALTKNLLRAMDERRVSQAVLVTGGYHSPGITERLTKAGAAVISFTPKIEKIDTAQGSAYLSVFTQEKTPLEKMFQGEKLFLAPRPDAAVATRQAALATTATQIWKDRYAEKAAEYLQLVAPEIELLNVLLESNQVEISFRAEDKKVANISVRLGFDTKGNPSSFNEYEINGLRQMLEKEYSEILSALSHLAGDVSLGELEFPMFENLRQKDSRAWLALMALHPFKKETVAVQVAARLVGMIGMMGAEIKAEKESADKKEANVDAHNRFNDIFGPDVHLSFIRRILSAGGSKSDALTEDDIRSLLRRYLDLVMGRQASIANAPVLQMWVEILSDIDPSIREPLLRNRKDLERFIRLFFETFKTASQQTGHPGINWVGNIRVMLEILSGSGAEVPASQAADHSANLKSLIQRFRDDLATIGGGHNEGQDIDRALQSFERLIRQGLRTGQVDSREAARSLHQLNEMLIPRGYSVEQSPLGLSDERVFVLYNIERLGTRETDEGPVQVHYVGQVTRFSDGMLRGNPGWSSLFADDVKVFSGFIRLQDGKETETVLAGELPFKPVSPASSKGWQISRMAELGRRLIQKGLGGLTAQERIARQEEAVASHEVEHERLRRKLNLQEGDIVHAGLEEELAELRSMREEEPYHILAHIVELAAADRDFAWSILGRLTGMGPSRQQNILDRLDSLVEGPSDEFIRDVENAYQSAERYWLQENADKLQRITGNSPRKLPPYTGAGDTSIHAALALARDSVGTEHMVFTKEMLGELLVDLQRAQDSQNIEPLMEKWNERFPSQGAPDLLIHDITTAIAEAEDILNQIYQSFWQYRKAGNERISLILSLNRRHKELSVEYRRLLDEIIAAADSIRDTVDLSSLGFIRIPTPVGLLDWVLDYYVPQIIQHLTSVERAQQIWNVLIENNQFRPIQEATSLELWTRFFRQIEEMEKLNKPMMEAREGTTYFLGLYPKASGTDYADAATADLVEAPIPDHHFFMSVMRTIFDPHSATKEYNLIRLIDSYNQYYGRSIELNIQNVEDKKARKREILQALRDIILMSDGMPGSVRARLRQLIAAYVHEGGIEATAYNDEQEWVNALDVPATELLKTLETKIENDPNPSIRTGDVTSEQINEAIKTPILTGRAYKVWDRSTAPTLADDVPIRKSQAMVSGIDLQQAVITGARKHLDAESNEWLDRVDIVIIEGQDLLYFRDGDNHQSLHVGRGRHVVYVGAGLWSRLVMNPRALAAMLRHELFHIAHPEGSETEAKARERLDSDGADELRRIIDSLANPTAPGNSLDIPGTGPMSGHFGAIADSLGARADELTGAADQRRLKADFPDLKGVVAADPLERTKILYKAVQTLIILYRSSPRPERGITFPLDMMTTLLSLFRVIGENASDSRMLPSSVLSPSSRVVFANWEKLAGMSPLQIADILLKSGVRADVVPFFTAFYIGVRDHIWIEGAPEALLQAAVRAMGEDEFTSLLWAYSRGLDAAQWLKSELEEKLAQPGRLADLADEAARLARRTTTPDSGSIADFIVGLMGPIRKLGIGHVFDLDFFKERVGLQWAYAIPGFWELAQRGQIPLVDIFETVVDVLDMVDREEDVPADAAVGREITPEDLELPQMIDFQLLTAIMGEVRSLDVGNMGRAHVDARFVGEVGATRSSADWEPIQNHLRALRQSVELLDGPRDPRRGATYAEPIVSPAMGKFFTSNLGAFRRDPSLRRGLAAHLLNIGQNRDRVGEFLAGVVVLHQVGSGLMMEVDQTTPPQDEAALRALQGRDIHLIVQMLAATGITVSRTPEQAAAALQPILSEHCDPILRRIEAIERFEATGHATAAAQTGPLVMDWNGYKDWSLEEQVQRAAFLVGALKAAQEDAGIQVVVTVTMSESRPLEREDLPGLHPALFKEGPLRSYLRNHIVTETRTPGLYTGPLGAGTKLFIPALQRHLGQSPSLVVTTSEDKVEKGGLDIPIKTFASIAQTIQAELERLIFVLLQA